MHPSTYRFGPMGWAKWAQGEKLNAPILTLSFHTFTITVLSLILPLSFLLLATLPTPQHLLTYTPYPTTPTSIILSFFLYTTPPLIHALVSSISAAALVYTLTGQSFQMHMYMLWGLLFVLLLFMGLSIQATTVAGFKTMHVGEDGHETWACRVLFFVGLYETMSFWTRTVVRPVADDTIFGVTMEEWIVERVVTGVAFGTLWWCRLRSEVDRLVVMVEDKRELFVGFVGWMVYYMTVSIGVARLVKGCVWLFHFLVFREPKKRLDYSCDEDVKV